MVSFNSIKQQTWFCKGWNWWIKMEEKTCGQDSRVERPWAHLSGAYHNPKYLWNNHWWKRLEHTRKGLLQLQTLRRNHNEICKRSRLTINQIHIPGLTSHKLENNYTTEILPQKWELWATYQLPQPSSPPPLRRQVLGVFGFEASRS